MGDILAGAIILVALAAACIVSAALLLRRGDLVRERDDAKRALLREQRRREHAEHLLSVLYTEAKNRAESGDQISVYFVDLIETETRNMDGVIIDR